jgi:hypothetical protein
MSGQIQLSHGFCGLENTPQSLLNLTANAMRSNIRDTSDEEAFQTASAGYVFGYPLVLMDVTRRVRSNFSRICPKGAPINQFLHQSQFGEILPPDILKVEMTGSTAWLDLTDEPLILNLPDMGKRYHKMQMLDAWTNVFATPGTRTIGNGKAYFAITGPNWRGTLPMGLRQIKSPTNLALIVGSTHISNHADCALLRKIQTQYKLAPLSAWDRTYFAPDTVPVNHETDMTTSPLAQVASMDAVEFLGRLSQLLRHNPPAPADGPVMAKLAKLGISRDDVFAPQTMAPKTVRAICDGVEHGRAMVESAAKKPRVMLVNGWEVSTNTGRYGIDYLRRAAIACSGLEVSVPEDTTSLRTTVDCNGHRLTGEKGYILHFSSKKTPPVRAFWSLTMYDAHERLVDNPIHRFTLGDCHPLAHNPDGSLDVYIQHGRPGGQAEANWLPAPRDEFNLVLRLYWPKNDVWEGRWLVPGVRPTVAWTAVAA